MEILILFWPVVTIFIIGFIASRAAAHAKNGAGNKQAWERRFSERPEAMLDSSEALRRSAWNGQAQPKGTKLGSLDAGSGNLGTGSGSLGTSSGSLGTSSGSLGTSSGNLGTSSGSLGTSSGSLDLGYRSYSEADGKPIVKHSIDDCTGGSIHTDYHEGTALKQTASGEGRHIPSGNPAPDSGAARKGTKDARKRGIERAAKDEALTGTSGAHTAYAPANEAGANMSSVPVNEDNGAERLQSRISTLPAAVQGMIWSEVLSRPISDR